MGVTVDHKQLDRSIRRNNKRLTAIRRTMQETGEGEVLVSRRIKVPGDTQRAVHGRAIANIMRTRGKDPFEYPGHVRDTAERLVKRGVTTAREKAYRQGRSRRRDVRNTLEGAAQFLADWARINIQRGGLGQKPRRRKWTDRQVRAYWRSEARRRRATTRYGNPPPYGVRTGQFVKGIRARWRRGRDRGF